VKANFSPKEEKAKEKENQIPLCFIDRKLIILDLLPAKNSIQKSQLFMTGTLTLR